MYWKIVEFGVIKQIGRSNPPVGVIITVEEYNQILAVITSQTFEEGYIYELLEDLTWRITPIPEPEPEDDADDN